MMRKLRNDTEMRTFLSYLRIAIKHHAQNISAIIDHIYDAITSFKDEGSEIVVTNESAHFRIHGEIYRLVYDYKEQKIVFSQGGANGLLIAEFDNTSSEQEVFAAFQAL